MQGKALITSWEFWVNFPAFLAGLLALPEFVAVVPAQWMPYILLVSAALTLGLRTFRTSRPITGLFRA